MRTSSLRFLRRTLRAAAGLHAAWLLASLTATAPAAAGPLADPTRPPTPPVVASSGSPTPGASAVRPAAEPRAVPQLQSIQVPEQGPASAVIDGRLVQAGERIGGLVIAAIDAQGVLLRTPTGSDRLWLIAAGAKQPAGSLTQTRSASFTPAPSPAVATPAAPTPEHELPRRSAQTLPGLPAGAVSLAGKTTP